MMPTPPVAYNSLGAVIGIAVLGSLVVALVALFIGYRHWQKGKEHQHLAVGYSSGRLDGSEYVMPGELARGRTHVRADSSAQGRWDAGLLHPSLDLGDGKRGAGEGKGGQRGQLRVSWDRTAVLGPGLCLTWQATPHLCLFVQMSLRATVTTTPTPATTPYHSAHRTPHPLRRSVLGVGVHGGCLVGAAPGLRRVPALRVPVPPLLPCQVPGSQLFASLQASERPGGAHGLDNHATLPADWKHRREPPAGPLDRGRSLGAKACGEGGRMQPSIQLHLSAHICRRGSGPQF